MDGKHIGCTCQIVYWWTGHLESKFSLHIPLGDQINALRIVTMLRLGLITEINLLMH